MTSQNASHVLPQRHDVGNIQRTLIDECATTRLHFAIDHQRHRNRADIRRDHSKNIRAACEHSQTESREVREKLRRIGPPHRYCDAFSGPRGGLASRHSGA